MFAKLAVLVVAIGACGCSLLALRQQRLQVASELTRAQLRIQAADERLWELRADIAMRTTPGAVRVLAAELGPMKPVISVPTGLPADWVVADGQEVLPIVPRLNEPAGTPAPRRVARTTPAAKPAVATPPARASAATRGVASRPAPGAAAKKPAPPGRSAGTPAASREPQPARPRTKPPAKLPPGRVAKTDDSRR